MNNNVMVMGVDASMIDDGGWWCMAMVHVYLCVGVGAACYFLA
jgi:hypothetical protein